MDAKIALFSAQYLSNIFFMFFLFLLQLLVVILGQRNEGRCVFVCQIQISTAFLKKIPYCTFKF